MASNLGDRLSAARRRQFVGRQAELASFQSALASDDLPFQVLYVFGPGGVGKTTLLHEFARLCQQAKAPVTYIDARNIEPSPESFLNALRTTLGLDPSNAPLQVLRTWSDRYFAILIDTAEALTPLDDWLRDVFLPELPDNALVILAGRNSPSTAWQADPGWQTLVRVIALRNFGPEESRDYLQRRKVPADQHKAILSFTHGHPLALSLVGELFAQRQNIRFKPEDAPDVIKVLLEQFVQKVPGPAHRSALEACALVKVMTEALLAEMLKTSNVHYLFDWLRSLSFIELGQQGLFPHDLARETLVADLHWRNPDWYAELHRRARSYYAGRLQQTAGQEQQRILFDYIFLHRDNPVVRPFLEWQAIGSLPTQLHVGTDESILLAMVRTHEGESSARLAAYWFARQPTNTLVFYDSDGEANGFLTQLALESVAPNDRTADPAVKAAWQYLNQHAPLRPGERATHFRFWLGRDIYQAVSPVQSLIFVNVVRHYLTTPALAFTFFSCAEPDFWQPILSYADLQRLPEADYEVDGRRYGVYGHDWRATPPHAWLTLLAEREVATESPVAPPESSMSIIVLSQPEFSTAIREALRDMRDAPATLLRNSVLLRSRMVTERLDANANNSARVALLQTLIREAAESLQSSPREAKLYRALYHTYLQPAPTQEKAAELLDVPFSTYRRHMKAGLARLTDILWQKEIGGPRN